MTKRPTPAGAGKSASHGGLGIKESRHGQGPPHPDDQEAAGMLMDDDASDEEILAYYRERDPYITLDSAKKRWQYSMRWWHLARSAEARRRQERRDAERLLREKLWPATGHVARATKNAEAVKIAERYAAGRPRPGASSGG